MTEQRPSKPNEADDAQNALPQKAMTLQHWQGSNENMDETVYNFLSQL